MADEHFYLGIDLGTTNSSIHWGAVNPATKRVEPRTLAFDQQTSSGAIERRVLLPSYIWFRQGEPEPIVGDYARTRGLEAQPSRVARAVKNHMGQATWRFQVDGKSYSAAQLSASIMQTLYGGIRRTWGSPVTDVVVTVPASFDSDMRADTIEAARLAGFKIGESDGRARNLLLDEPRAALHDLINQQLSGHLPPGMLDLSAQKTILVFDLGGGTLDVSLHLAKQSTDLSEIDVQDLAISRYTQLGGGVFDGLIADELQRRFEARGKVNLASIPEVERNQVRVKLEVQAEHIKQRLTNDIEDRLSRGADAIPDDFAVDVQMPFLYDNKGLFTRFTKKEFELAIAPLLGHDFSMSDVDTIDTIDYTKADNVIYPILDVLSKAQRQLGSRPKIDAVVLNGGMTRVHAIRERLTRFFGIRPITVLDPEHSVSRGAAVYHYLIHRGWRPRQILAESIGVEVDGAQVFHLVPAGTVLPHRTRFSNRFFVPFDQARMLDIPLYRGEKKTPEPPNRKILERRFLFSQPQTAGTPIDVEVIVDDNKLLSFIAVLPNGERAEVRVAADDAGEQAPLAPAAPQPPISEPASPTGPRLDVNTFVRQLRSASSSWNEATLKDLGRQALSARNHAELISAMISSVNTLQRPGKQRVLWVMGEYARRYPDSPAIKDIVNACLTNMRSSLGNPASVVTVGRNAIVAMGKAGLPIAESHLVNLLDDPRLEAVVGDVITSIGKCAVSTNAIVHLSQHLDAGREGARINSLWALGRIGSREHDPVLPMSDFLDLIPAIAQRTDPKIEPHPTARKNAVYALGEIGDRRASLNHQDVVDSEFADYILKVFERVRNHNTRAALSGNTNQDELHQTERFVEIANRMVQGEALSAEDHRILMSVRTLMSVSDD